MQETVGDLHNIMRRDFYVISPCESVTTPGKIHEGTRLTIQYHPPDGYDYSIRTPGTPPRWADFEVVRWVLERKKKVRAFVCVRFRREVSTQKAWCCVVASACFRCVASLVFSRLGCCPFCWNLLL